MRYGSLFAAAAVVVGLAACKGNDSGMNADLAKDLASARSNDALALAPRAGVQTVVSAQELSPQGRAHLAASSRSSRAVAHHTPHRDHIARPPAASQVASAGPAVEVSSPAPAPDPATVSAPTPRPQPVDVSYPSSGSGNGSGRGEGGGGGSSGIGGLGGIIGAIGGAILRGGVVDGDHCDPRSHRGGGILINRRGPILRGSF